MRKRRQYGTGGIYQRPDGKWVGSMEAGWTERGTRRRVSVIAPTESEAKRRLRDKHRAAIAGEQITGRAPTVKAWSVTWLADYERRVRPKTYATDSSILRRWIIPTVGNRRLADLGAGDVRKLVNAVRDAGRTTTTAGYVQSIFLRMLKAARASGHKVPEPVFSVPRPTAAVSDRDALTVADAVDVLNAASQRPDGSRWVAALLQGMRQAECLGLTWECVDLDRERLDISWQLQALPYKDRERETFRVPDGYEARRLEGAAHLVRPKTAQGHRVIPLLPWMMEPLQAWRDVVPLSPYGLVWPDERGRPRSDAVDRADWYGLTDEAQVAQVDGTVGRRYLLHESRHTTATLLLAARVDPAVITAILGHSSIVVSRGYMHVDDAALRDALGRVGALLDRRDVIEG